MEVRISLLVECLDYGLIFIDVRVLLFICRTGRTGILEIVCLYWDPNLSLLWG